ncbi:unnamed protein product, partial [Schistocephalus solidus]|uniref:NADH-cytochrome b5 reductase n=1 Tax=Schistocephalus solidus TaxID=70667 RepID=A0A183SWL0_SCHSO
LFCLFHIPRGGVVAVVVVGGIVAKFLFKKKEKVTLLGPSVKISLRLVDKEKITHDSNLYTFALPSNDHILGLPNGSYVRLHARIDGENVVRPYTPISLHSDRGYVKFLIKTYRKNVHPNFPAGGKMTQALEALTNDSCVDVSGPCGNLVYNGDGCFEIKGSNPRKIHAKRISMICGGSGLTPMYQLIKAIIMSDTDTTKIALLYANKTEDDILLKDELDKLRDDNPEQFRVWYTVGSPPSNWPYGVGYVDSRMMEEHIFPAGPDSFALICGPPPMLQSACIPNLKAIGYTPDMYYAF